MKCKHLKNGHCEVVSQLVGIDIPILDNECDACNKCLLPQQLNYITASVAYRNVSNELRDATLTDWSAKGYFLLGRREKIELKLPDGPGTELHKLLKDKGYDIEPGCSCLKTIAKMNSGGPEWCRNNIKSIVDSIAQEAHRRKIIAPDLVIRFFAKRLTLTAIRNYEKATSQNALTSG